MIHGKRDLLITNNIEIEIELKEMYPSFRGRLLDQPNFSFDSFESISFLIGNNKQENFHLLIDSIYLK